MRTIRVALPGVNALESNPDPRDYSLLSDEDNILIKEHSRGTVNEDSETIAHNLGYFPHFYTYGEVSSGRFQIMTGYNLFGALRSYVDDTNLYLANILGFDGANMRYFIFYDDVPI